MKKLLNNTNLLPFFTKLLLVLTMALTAYSCGGPDHDNPNTRHRSACDCQYKFGDQTLKLRIPMKQEELILDQILDKTGISKRVFNLCRVKDMKGAAAFATFFQGKNFIVYDGKYFSQASLNQKRRVLSHEAGHILHFHSLLTDGSVYPQDMELEADYFSGRMLFKFGVPLGEAINLISEGFITDGPHPSGVLQRSELKKGWLAAERNERKVIVTKPAPQAYRTPSSSSAGRSSLATSPPKPKPNKPKPVETETIIYAEVVVRDFIQALGRREFKAAYKLQDNPSWGSLEFFSSPRSFGGITKTELLKPPKLVKCMTEGGDGGCLYGKVYVEYQAVDPVNDACKAGRVFKQFFWAAQRGGAWKIIKAKVEDMSCPTPESLPAR